MKLFTQFAESVTGSTLPNQFKQTRFHLSLFIFIGLLLLLLLSGTTLYERSRITIATIRPQGLYRPGGDFSPRNLSENEQKRIIEFEQQQANYLDDVRRNILISNAILLVLLTFISWLGLYFVLKPLADSVQRRELFVENASHELRTPLAILYSELSLSKNITDSTKLQKVHKNALFEIKRLQLLSDTLLNRLSNTTLITTKIRLTHSVQETWVKLNDQNHTLQNNIVKNIFVTIDQSAFEQLLFNLFENATKHSPQGTVILSIFEGSKLQIKNECEANFSHKPGIGMRVQEALTESMGLTINHTTEDMQFITTINNFTLFL